MQNSVRNNFENNFHNKKDRDFSILIVDDSSQIRYTLHKLLGNDCNITRIDEAINGANALDMVRVNHYDLILLDIAMPVMDGIEFLKRCKLHTNARVIVLSAPDELKPYDLEKARFFGAYDIISKPAENELADYPLSTRSQLDKRPAVTGLLDFRMVLSSVAKSVDEFFALH